MEPSREQSKPETNELITLVEGIHVYRLPDSHRVHSETTSGREVWPLSDTDVQRGLENLIQSIQRQGGDLKSLFPVNVVVGQGASSRERTVFYAIVDKPSK